MKYYFKYTTEILWMEKYRSSSGWNSVLPAEVSQMRSSDGKKIGKIIGKGEND
jgi:hypothetical protein